MSDRATTTASRGRRRSAPKPTGDSLTWAGFEGRLATALERMAVDQFFILSTRGADDDESLYYVQFAQGGRAGFVAEAVSNEYLMGGRQLSPAQEEAMGGLGWMFPTPRASKPENFNRQWPMPTPVAEIARLAIRTLREVYGVERPSDLVYRRFARGGHDFAEPGLGIDAERPTTPRGQGQPPAPTPEDLTPLVETALRQFLGTATVALDESGNYPLTIGTTSLFVRILPSSPPLVRVFAPVFAGMAPTPGLLEAVNETNTEVSFCRVLYLNGQVIVAMEVRGVGISADDLAHACFVVAGVVELIRSRVAARLGAMPGPADPPRLPN